MFVTNWSLASYTREEDQCCIALIYIYICVCVCVCVCVRLEA